MCVSAREDQGRQTTFDLDIEGHNTHFSESIPLVFLKRGEHFVVIRDLEAVDDHHLAGQVTLDKFVPALSWDVFVNSPVDGTMSFANGFFAQGLTASTKAKSPDNDEVLERLSQADLGFHFPFQPNIMETIRNLMLHVPMWFTMFLLMGISFAQSIRSLGTSGTAEHDMKALASVKTGMWFGVLGLLTGSLWAKFTWGAWWVDDPQLNGAFVTVMVYAGYLVLRSSVQDEALRTRCPRCTTCLASVCWWCFSWSFPGSQRAFTQARAETLPSAATIWTARSGRSSTLLCWAG